MSTLTKLVANPCVTVAEKAKACVHCGKIWGDLDLGNLEELIRKYGTDECKGRLSFDLNG